MKTVRINLTNLRNEEHFQFHSEFKTLVSRFDASTIGIEAAFAGYLPLFAREEEALNVIRKSAFTKELARADTARDSIYRGFADAVKSAQNHYNAEKKVAAKKFAILLRQFGNIARKTYDAASASYIKLVDEANTTYAPEIITMELTEWITEIDKRSKAFDELMNNRFSKGAQKTPIRMMQARAEIDAAYRAIANRLDALMILNETAPCIPFVLELNVRADKYKTNLAQRQGRAAKAEKVKKEAKIKVPASPVI